MSRILALLALLAWLIILFPYPITVFMGGAIACLTLPAYRWLRARLGRTTSAAAYAGGLSLCLLAPLTIVTMLVAPQVAAGVRRLNSWRQTGRDLSTELAGYIDMLETWTGKIPGLSEWLAKTSANLGDVLNSAARVLLSGGIGIAGSTMNAIWMLFLFVVLASLGVVYAPTLRKITLRITRLPEDSLDRFLLALRSALRAVVVGVIIVSIVQGILTGIGLRLAGVQEPAFWGLLATFAAVIPVMGTALVWGPLALALWLRGHMGAALFLLVWGSVVVAGSDNLVRPYFLKTGIEAPMFVLLLSILCSMAAFGPIGLILGPVLVAFAIQAVRESDLLLRRTRRGA